MIKQYKLSLIPFLILILASIQLSYAQEVELGHRVSPLPTPVAALDFTLTDTDDIKHTLAALKGRVVIINFWAVWCPPCRKEMPSLERLRIKMADKAVSILAVNQGEDAEQILSYLWGLKPVPEFPILLDKDMKVSASWKVTGLPATYIINKKGDVVYRMIGGREFDHPNIVKVINELVAE